MKVRLLLLFAVLLLVVAPLARGENLELRLTPGFGPAITVLDNGFGDQSMVPGVILWSGEVNNRIFSVDTGISNPLGSPLGSLHLNSVDEMEYLAHLCIELTRWGMTTPLSHSFQMDISGMIDSGNVTYDAFRGTGKYSEAQTIGVLGPYGSGNFDGTLIGEVGPAFKPYSLTQRITINTEHASTTSFDATLKPVPEPGTGILLGLGALAIGTLLRRRFA